MKLTQTLFSLGIDESYVNILFKDKTLTIVFLISKLSLTQYSVTNFCIKILLKLTPMLSPLGIDESMIIQMAVF